MSSEEMRSYCLSIKPYNLRVQVRLKDGSEICVGKLGTIEDERFQLVTDDEGVKSLRFAWVARITNA